MSRIAFATCTPLPEPDPDEELLVEACKARGLDVSIAAWNNPSIDWNEFDVVIVRSTWNYYENAQAFRSWALDVSKDCRLWNPAPLILENLDKRYLAAMAAAGVPVVPTRFVDDSSLEAVLKETGWDDFVIKPTISAGSFMTARFQSVLDASRFLEELERSHRGMVQKFMPSVHGEGEASLIYIGGELTHSIVKKPRFLDDEESVSEATIPTDGQIETATKAFATIKEPWLYARVDLMVDNDGQWLLSELELIEPSLFFKQHPPALERFITKVQELALG